MTPADLSAQIPVWVPARSCMHSASSPTIWNRPARNPKHKCSRRQINTILTNALHLTELSPRGKAA